MIYKSLNKDFFYEDSRSTRLSYYLTCGDETIYTGRAYNPNGIKINLRKIIEDWLWNDMPDFREYDGVIVTHEDAYKPFNLYNDEGTLLEEYKVFLSYEDWQGEDMFFNNPIDGKADPRQKIFVSALESIPTSFDIVGWAPLEVSLTGDFDIPAEGGTIEIGFVSNTAFTVETTCDWLTVTKSGDTEGTLIIEADENDDEDRVCTITMRQDDYVGSECAQEGRAVSFTISQDVLVPPQELYDTYLTFDILSAGTITWKRNYSDTYSTQLIPIEYTLDSGITWTEIQPSDSPAISVSAGDSVMFRGNNSGGTSLDYSGSWRTNFSGTTAVFNVRGNLLSIVYGDGFRGKDSLPIREVFYNGGIKQERASIPSLFTNCKVVSAREMVIPVKDVGRMSRFFQNCNMLTTGPIFGSRTGDTSVGTTYGGEHFYRMFYGCTSLTGFGRKLKLKNLMTETCSYMFYGCTSLAKAPVTLGIFNTDRSTHCQYMFGGCTSLVKAPDLHMGVTPSQCCIHMFDGCTNLEKSPLLDVETISGGAFAEMFSGCTSLSYIVCLATGVLRWDQDRYLSTNNWTKGVSAIGTFVKSPDMDDWTWGTSGIPSGWTVIDAS